MEKQKTAPKKKNTGLILGVIVLLLLLAGVIALMVISQPETSILIKDISIVAYVFAFLISVVSLIILVVQLSRLVNLVKNEVKPILDTTKETVYNVKGTVSFMSDNMVSPVINTNAKIAGAAKLFSLFKKGLKR